MSVSTARLRLVRDRLLRLHKLLLDAERAAYERAYGPVASSGEWLRLVLAHEHFTWLRPMSGLIVRIDEWIARADATMTEAAGLIEEADALTRPDAAADHAARLEETLDRAPEARAALEATREAIGEARRPSEAS